MRTVYIATISIFLSFALSSCSKDAYKGPDSELSVLGVSAQFENVLIKSRQVKTEDFVSLEIYLDIKNVDQYVTFKTTDSYGTQFNHTVPVKSSELVNGDYAPYSFKVDTGASLESITITGSGPL